MGDRDAERNDLVLVGAAETASVPIAGEDYFLCFEEAARCLQALQAGSWIDQDLEDGGIRLQVDGVNDAIQELSDELVWPERAHW